MELREYWSIIQRRWWIPVVLVLLVGVISLVQLRPWQAPPVSYTASMRLLVGVLPAADSDVAAYDPRYYSWLTSEYLVDDFTEVVRSELFAANVSRRLADQAIQAPPGVILGSAATGKLHRILTLTFNWGNRDELNAIASAAARELTDNTAFYFQQLGTEGAGVTIIDGPNIGEVGPSLRSRLDLPLRLLLAFVIGLGILFLLDYLDQSVRNDAELEALGFSVLGRIPRQRGK